MLPLATNQDDSSQSKHAAIALIQQAALSARGSANLPVNVAQAELQLNVLLVQFVLGATA